MNKLIFSAKLCSILALIFLVYPSAILAKQITLETTIGAEPVEITQKKTKTDNKKLKVSVQVKNQGDETAYSLFPTIVLKEQDYPLGDPKDLAPGQDFLWTGYLNLDLLNINLPGSYPLPVLIYFKDANGASFTTPRLHQFDYGQHSPGRLAIKVLDTDRNIAASGKKSTQIILQNLDAEAKEISLSVLHAQELIAKLELNTVTLPADAQKVIRVEFENFRGLPGTASLVYFIAQYQHNNKHYCENSSSYIQEKEQKELSAWFTNSWLFFSLLLAIIFIYLIINSKKTTHG